MVRKIENKLPNAFTIKPDLTDWTHKQKVKTKKQIGGAASRDKSNGQIIAFCKNNSYLGSKKL